MANTLITPTIIAKVALVQLENNLVFGNTVYREYKNEFVKIGNSVNIRRPVKFYTADGATRVNQDVEEKDFPILVDQRKHVSWNFSTQDLTLTVEQYSERYIKPAMITLAQTIDTSLAALYPAVWNTVGTPGTTPASFQQVSPVAQRLDEMAVPMPRNLALNPAATYAIAGDQVGLDSESKIRTAYDDARIGRIANMTTFSSQNIQTHVVGNHGGTPLVNGAAQNTTYAVSGSTNWQTLITDGWTASVASLLTPGDVFTIDGVFAVNPVPGDGNAAKNQMPYLQQFTVLDAAASDGGGNATLTISPAIIVDGPFQTVSAAPADNAPITVNGAAAGRYAQNLGYHQNAFSLVMVPLEMPDGASFKARESANGMSVRVIKDYDIDNDLDIIRIDVLYGRDAIYPDLACRLQGEG